MSNVQWWFKRRWAKGLSPGAPPSLASLVPSTAVHGATSVALSVNGSNLQPGSQINFGTTNYPATFVNSTQLTATIAAADLATAGTKTVKVIGPSGTSNGLTFTLT